jgi:hypothetical protein
VSFIARNTFRFLATTTFTLFMCLMLWGYHNDLEHIIQPPPQPTYPTKQSSIITAYHSLPETPHISYTLAATLAQNPIKKIAFSILLSFKSPRTVLTAYAHHAQFGAVQSLPKAANYYFGVSTQSLSIGETLLLFSLAHNPTLPITDPIATHQYRNTLLNKLYNNKILTDHQYHIEQQKALALAADHRPIN